MSDRTDDYTPTKPHAVDVKGRPEAELREALAADPTDERAAARLSAHLIAMGRFAEAAGVIEAELDALAAIDEPGADGAGNGAAPAVYAQRRAERHRQVAGLWEGKLGRIDRAL